MTKESQMKSSTPSAEFPRSGADQNTVNHWFQALSNWGRWGAEDRLGALNLITNEKRAQAAALVRTGTSISLARDAIKERVGVSAPFEHVMVESSETPGAESAGDVFSVQYHGYTQTHLDALCHIFHGDYMFNGLSKNKVTNQGASELSVLEMKTGIFTRGVLLDIPRTLHLPYLKAEDAIYPEQLDTCLKQANTHIESGDALVIRTGRWAREQREGRWEVEQGSAGLHASCLPWLKKHDIAVLTTDLAADLLPSQVAGVRMPIHLVTIAAMGVPIIDNCDPESLAVHTGQEQRWDFLFVASPLAVPGGTGSPINPLGLF
jgi:kynurenine formamidase